MFPDQQNPNGGQPGPQPQPAYQPPATGVNSAPVVAAGGQYEVVPPPSVTGRPTGHNPYEFIVNPQQVKAPRGNLLGGNSFAKQIAVIVGLAVIIMIVVAVGLSMFGPKGNTSGLSGLAEQQQEIVRVATEVATQASGQDTKNFATNVELSVASNQTQLLAYLKSHGTKLGNKQLALDQNAQTDTLLTNAAAANSYDHVAVQALTNALQTYQGQLQTTFKQTTSPQAKQLLQSSYSAAALLLEQAKAVQS